MPHNKFLKFSQDRVAQVLDQLLPTANSEPKRLHSAMRYSVLNPGKRIRPALVYATGEMFSVDYNKLDRCAAAVELIHAYSLIHDDLPCMDDDELRRGIATCHIQYDEATAVLAGDALQTLAFELLSNPNDPHLSASEQVMMMNCLAEASGSLGMGGGQAIDLLMTNNESKSNFETNGPLETLESMHHMKTGALISTAVKLGFLASNCEDQVIMTNLESYSRSLGLAFQIRDDILDVEGDTQTLGKPQGSDEDKNKLTFPSLLGLEGAKQRANDLLSLANDSLQRIPLNCDNLADFAGFVVSRKN